MRLAKKTGSGKKEIYIETGIDKLLKAVNEKKKLFLLKTRLLFSEKKTMRREISKDSR